ncbi:hypothetical protein [Clostridium beijerinckii]|uniref:hypothetical protein n=1 Tax=Clostridium beijerinckii TaxID=1520 RepID=UPI0022E0FB39|nr:hypothetical protein [Clostridium beijerinckii]
MNSNNNNYKLLPVKYPPITSYPHHANILSFLSCNEENLSWFYNYYFQLSINKNNDIRLDFNIGYSIIPFIKNCPIVTFHGLSRELIKRKWDTLTNFLIDSIDLGYYIYLVVDKFFIPAYEDQYMKYHSYHDIMIFGYNVEDQNFNIADFFKGSKYYYSVSAFSKIEEGYQSSEEFDWLHGVILLKEDKSYQPNFSINILKDFINDYLASYNSNARTILINTWLNNKDFAFGLQVYDVLENHLKELSNNIDSFDIRPYHVLWDHKKMILLLIKFLFKKGYLKNADYFYSEFALLEKKILILRNILLEYKITTKKYLINKVILILKETSVKEQHLLQELIVDIKEYAALYIPSNLKITYSSLYISYSDNWKELASEICKSYCTNNLNEYAHFKFYGSSINFITTKSDCYGYLDIFIDDIKEATIDLYSEKLKYNELVYSNRSLPLGYHSMKVVCTGEKNNKSKDCFITLGAFEVSSNKCTKVIPNTAKLLSIDTTSQGTWINSFGKDGYAIIGSHAKYPIYADIRYKNAEYYRFPDTSNDNRALQNPNDSNDRILAIMCNPDSFEMQMCISGPNEKMITLYLVDFDCHEREVYIEVLDEDNKQIILTHTVRDFNNGIYLTFAIKGRINFRFKNVSNNKTLYQNAVLSGVFFDSIQI